MTPVKRRATNEGFTILEILLAVVILTVGLLGLLAVFPVAMRTGKQAVETTNAVLISHSVEQAVREGLRDRKYQSKDGKWTYFIFSHDGVTDELPRSPDQARWDADYYILLPSPDPDRKASLTRIAHWDRGKTFVFPESDGAEWEVNNGGVVREVSDDSSGSPPNGRGNPNAADDDKDDRTIPDGAGGEYTEVDVRRVYHLSNRFFNEEMYDQGIVDDDPISQYSFAFSIRPALQDSSLEVHFPGSRNIVPSGELFEVEIYVFRSFREGTTSADPFYRTQILVHK